MRDDGYARMLDVVRRTHDLSELKGMTRDEVLYHLRIMVEGNAKQRFQWYLGEYDGQWKDGTPVTEVIPNDLWIRCVQGHGTKITGLDPLKILEPLTLDDAFIDFPPVVIHGTKLEYWDSIQKHGILAGHPDEPSKARHMIHHIGLEPENPKVISGFRHSSRLALYVDIVGCLNDGMKWYRSTNGVVLTDGIEGYKGMRCIPYQYVWKIRNLTNQKVQQHFNPTPLPTVDITSRGPTRAEPSIRPSRPALSRHRDETVLMIDAQPEETPAQSPQDDGYPDWWAEAIAREEAARQQAAADAAQVPAAPTPTPDTPGVEHGNVSTPGVTATDVASRFQSIWATGSMHTPMPAAAMFGDDSNASEPFDDVARQRVFAEQARINQQNRLQDANTVPFPENEWSPHGPRWMPTYAWTPDSQQSRPPYVPAFFTHPRFSHNAPPAQPHLDPPVFQEYYSQMRGTPLHSPHRTDNRFTRQLIDEIHAHGHVRTGDPNTTPYFSYHPSAAPEGEYVHPPGIVAPDNQLLNNSARTPYLREVHDSQQAAMQRAEERRKGKGKGKGKGKPWFHFVAPHDTANESTASSPAVTQYRGDNSTCTICLENYQSGDMVYRMDCNHLFHEECWHQYILRDGVNPECPNCRGPGVPKSLFSYIATPARDDAMLAIERLRQQHRQGASPAPSRGSQGFGDAQSHFSDHTTVLFTAEEIAEWVNDWEASTTMTLEEFIANKKRGVRGNTHPPSDDNSDHDQEVEPNNDDPTWVHLKVTSRTKLPDGKLSMLADLGSRINIIGENTIREFDEVAKKHGHTMVIKPRAQRLNVNGVGSGSAPCDEEADIPIAVRMEDSNTPKTDVFRANIAKGSGANLPAILGSLSMQEKDAVILLRKGKEAMVFPGPGGYKIEWSPGTKILPMVPAPSGHLVIPCDRFADADTTAAGDVLTFHTDHTH